jgi:uncharacterized paraquat-inducible protein A
MPVPLKQATVGRGKSYQCPECEQRLRTGKPSKLAAAGMFVAASILAKFVGFLPVVILLLLGAMIEFATVRVSLDGKAQR